MSKTKATNSPPKTINLQGIPVSPGIQIGQIYIHDPKQHAISTRVINKRNIDKEKTRLNEAVQAAQQTLLEVRRQVVNSIDETHASIFDFQLMMLKDPTVIQKSEARIEEKRENAALAFMTVVKDFARQLASIDDAYIAGREVDIMDVGHRVCSHLTSKEETQLGTMFDQDVIVVSKDLSPSDTAQFDHDHILAFATELGGPTSHSAILAKALEIPAVVALGSFLDQVQNGQTVIIDGYDGSLTVNATSREITRARSRRRRYMVHERDLEKLRDLPAETIDGYRVDVSANLELPIEIPHVASHGCNGVGLFRTEFIFLEADRLPDEEEQFAVYKRVAEKVAPQYVIFRTLDLGGDKFLTQSITGQELNPFLGLRAIRLCLAHPEIFRTQLRALLRASAFGEVKIMFPMISNLSELQLARHHLHEVMEELSMKGIAYNEKIEVGCMIEIPSAALCAGELAQEVDFFSIGTNDLIQYTLAVDRVNEQVAALYDPFNPAILKLIRLTIEAAHQEGIWCGVCGEMSADPLCALMLIGLGIDELSMGPLAVPEIKRLVRQIHLADARKVVQDIYACRTSDEIHEYVNQALRKFKRRRIKSSSSQEAVGT